MRVIGVIGGMSAESTALYYARINASVRASLGGLNAAEIILWSVNFAEIAAMQSSDRWREAGRRLADVARRLEGAGADVIILATNTMHKVAGDIEAAITVPFIHIADATAEEIKRAGFKRPGLMATAYTMEQDFYTSRLMARHGLDVVIPEASDRAETHRIIYDELCNGEARDESRASYQAIAARLIARGADCIILGCTEVGMLLNAANTGAPVFDTTLIHADAAARFALAPAARQAAE